MGRPVTSLARLVQLLATSVWPEILNSPCLTWQVSFLATQGQACSPVMPWSLTYLNALSINPPLHPWFPYKREQSTSCCSEKDCRVPNPSLLNPSSPPVVEKAQQDPHCPWSLMGVTAPAATQSTSPTDTKVSSTSTLSDLGTLVPRQVEANSSWVRWVNWLIPISQVLSFWELCALIFARFCRKTLSRQVRSTLLSYLSPYADMYSSKLMSAGVLSSEKRASPRRATTNAKETLDNIDLFTQVIERPNLKAKEVGINIDY